MNTIFLLVDEYDRWDSSTIVNSDIAVPYFFTTREAAETAAKAENEKQHRQNFLEPIRQFTDHFIPRYTEDVKKAEALHAAGLATDAEVARARETLAMAEKDLERKRARAQDIPPARAWQDRYDIIEVPNGDAA